MRVGGIGLINNVTVAFSVVVVTAILGILEQRRWLDMVWEVDWELMLTPLVFGVGSALTAGVGANVGAQNFQRARSIAWAGASIAFLVTGGIGIIMAVMPELWLDWFTADEAAYKDCCTVLGDCWTVLRVFCAGQAIVLRKSGNWAIVAADLCWCCTLPDYFLGGPCGGLDGLADPSGFCRSQRWITCDRYRHGSLLIQSRLATSSANQQKLIVKLPYELNSVGKY